MDMLICKDGEGWYLRRSLPTIKRELRRISMLLVASEEVRCEESELCISHKVSCCSVCFGEEREAGRGYIVFWQVQAISAGYRRARNLSERKILQHIVLSGRYKLITVHSVTSSGAASRTLTLESCSMYSMEYVLQCHHVDPYALIALPNY